MMEIFEIDRFLNGFLLYGFQVRSSVSLALNCNFSKIGVGAGTKGLLLVPCK